MGEVRYSINGKYFKDYNVLISSSDGIGDGLKRKKVNTYDWAEYNGLSVDLSLPKFEAREITLKGFVIGSNWDEMMENFNTIIYELQKPGTQRLLIEPFGMKPLPYEVYMEDSSPLEKTFKDGQMVGVFTIKLIEPNPIKKVLYLTDNTLNLSYNSSKETEIFFVNGEKTTAKGNVSLSGKTLANRNVSSYNFNGRNLILNSGFNIGGGRLNYWQFNNNPYNIIYRPTTGQNSLYLECSAINSGPFQGINFNNYSGPVTVSLEIAFNFLDVELNTDVIVFGIEGIFSKVIKQTSNNNWVKYSVTGNITNLEYATFILYTIQANEIIFSVRNIKVELGNKATDWTPAPEDEKYIIIAGNVDEITNLTTNAEVLWEKL